MKRTVVFLFAAFVSLSCSKFFEKTGEQVDVTGEISHEMIVLGDKLEDPYTVGNMSKALYSLYPTKADRGELSPTDYYVRFLPTSEDQYERLVSMGVVMLDHPVDFAIVREGDYYHDPEIAEGEITWQYAVVKKSFVFPSDIEWELLDECFVPDNSTVKSSEFDWEAVEREAFRLTGNESMLRPQTKGDSGSPSGRISIYDDTKNEEVGVKGVRVSCNVFVKFAHAYTDEDGNYSITRNFASEPRYRIVFKNTKGFGIGFNLLLVPASCSTLGKCSASGVSLRVDKDSESKLYTRCVVNNAAYEYYSQCSGEGTSIPTPPANLRLWIFRNMETSSATMLQQGAIIDGSLLDKYFGEYISLLKMFLPDLTIGLKGLSSFGDIYSVTVHECAHASHFMSVGKSYWNSYIKFIIKSFVTSGFVAYGAGTEEGHGYCEVGEMWAYYMQGSMYKGKYGRNVDFGTSYWFKPGILSTLEAKGLDRYSIFAAMTADVTDRDKLQAKLCSLYPQSRSAINQAFGSYE